MRMWPVTWLCPLFAWWSDPYQNTVISTTFSLSLFSPITLYLSLRIIFLSFLCLFLYLSLIPLSHSLSLVLFLSFSHSFSLSLSLILFLSFSLSLPIYLYFSPLTAYLWTFSSLLCIQFVFINFTSNFMLLQFFINLFFRFLLEFVIKIFLFLNKYLLKNSSKARS